MWGDILSTVGVFSTVGGYNEYCGGYLEYRGGYHDARGDIMSTVEGVQYRGGKNLLLFEYPTVLNIPHSTHDIPHMYHDIPHGTQISKDGIPPRYLTPPTVLMISPHAS